MSDQEILTRLPNGLFVYILKDTRFPLVCTRLYVKTGSANEDAQQAGISHVLEHMVFKGTENRPKGQTAKDIEALGGYLNAATSFDKTWYITDLPAQHWKVGLDVVKDMAFHASLDAKELEAEKEVIISELQGGEDNPGHKLFEELQVAGLKHSPYGRPIIGFEKTIRAVTSEDLRNYIARWYEPQNMSLLVAGDIEPQTVLAYVHKLFGDLKNTRDLDVLPSINLFASPDKEQVVVKRGNWNKVYLGLSFPAPAFRDERSSDVDVLCHILGGDGTSRFYRKYKYEERLVDDISVGNMSLSRAGLATITVQLDADKVERFWQELTKDLANLKNATFDNTEIQRAVFNIQDGMDKAKETLNGLAAWKSVVQFDLGGNLAERNMRARLDNMQEQNLKEAIATWLQPENCRVRVLAPQKASLPDFSAIMAQNWLKESKKDRQKEVVYTQGSREIIDLGQQRSVILLPDTNVPYISIKLMLPGGNALINAQQQGLPGLTARLLTDGCADLDAQGIEHFLAERAATLGASAGKQTFALSLEGPARFANDYFHLLGNIVQAPHFAEKEIVREKENMLAALQERKDQPLRYLLAEINPFLYGTHIYGYDDLGKPEILHQLTTDNVRNFWQKQITQAWVLSVAGSFEREAVLAFAQTLPEPSAQTLQVSVPHTGKQKSLDLHLQGRVQAHLLEIFPTVSPTHEDAPALKLLAAILSGQSGILFSSLRDEQGLGYTVTAFQRNMPETGFMAFYIGTVPDKIEQSKQGFASVLAKLKDELLPPELLATGVNRLRGSYVRGRQSLASRAGEAAVDRVLNYPQDFAKLQIDKAATLTPEDLRQVVRKYLNLSKSFTATLLPE